VCGLSPLARGTQNRREPDGGGDWFIPAGAGNTAKLDANLKDFEVYPRWRGEHGNLPKQLTRSTGLSPLARGTHLRDISDPAIRRFIPAGAGNTPQRVGQIAHRAVYPRWRGEHFQDVT